MSLGRQAGTVPCIYCHSQPCPSVLNSHGQKSSPLPRRGNSPIASYAPLCTDCISQMHEIPTKSSSARKARREFRSWSLNKMEVHNYLVKNMLRYIWNQVSPPPHSFSGSECILGFLHMHSRHAGRPCYLVQNSFMWPPFDCNVMNSRNSCLHIFILPFLQRA